MKKAIYLLSIILSLTACTKNPDYNLALHHVDVFDSRNKETYKDQTILIGGTP
ncbi:hypothetical protein [Sinomicrobium sp. M5D2P17]